MISSGSKLRELGQSRLQQQRQKILVVFFNRVGEESSFRLLGGRWHTTGIRSSRATIWWARPSWAFGASDLVFGMGWTCDSTGGARLVGLLRLVTCRQSRDFWFLNRFMEMYVLFFLVFPSSLSVAFVISYCSLPLFFLCFSYSLFLSMGVFFGYGREVVPGYDCKDLLF